MTEDPRPAPASRQTAADPQTQARPQSWAHQQAQWARLLLHSLAQAGVRQVVLSPGSRSTPFTAAALAHPVLQCLSVVDERAAAFLALGWGKASGRPALLICTSGTAGANYFPALLEAEMAYAPLLVLTADRPPELMHCHASQTLDQIKLFGDHVRGFFELGLPDSSVPSLRALRRLAAQAVHTATWPVPGPVHVNARARKPLEPAVAGGEAEEDLERRVDDLLSTPLVQAFPPRREPAPEAVAAIAQAIAGSERGLIVCGPLEIGRPALPAEVARLSALSGFPVLVEAGSQLRFAKKEGEEDLWVGAVDALGRSAAVHQHLAPEVILQVGAPPVAAGWSRLLEAAPKARKIVIHPHGWNDPTSDAWALVQADPEATIQALNAALPAQDASRGRAETAWFRAWRRAEALVWQVVEEQLEAAGDEVTEGSVARDLVAGLPAGALLAIGNSLPIREVDAYAPPSPRNLTVLTQRGVAGIDGLVAGAVGAALALDRPGGLLLGDLSLLHDLDGLACARFLRHPFALVVVNNDGGRIFEQLPIARLPKAQRPPLEAWTTPHGLTFEGAAALYRLPYARAKTRGGFRQALSGALSLPGATLIEVTVPPHGAQEQNQRLWAAVEQRLAAEGFTL